MCANTLAYHKGTRHRPPYANTLAYHKGTRHRPPYIFTIASTNQTIRPPPHTGGPQKIIADTCDEASIRWGETAATFGGHREGSQ